MFKNYLQSLLWIAFFSGIGACASIVSQFFVLSFMRFQTVLTREAAVDDLFSLGPIFSLILSIVALYILLPSQLVQSISAFCGERFLGNRWLPVVAFLPLTTIITWYCYDYLTPSNIDPNEYDEYVHGLTWVRFCKTLGFQAAVTTFSLLYDSAPLPWFSRRTVVLLAGSLALFGGAIFGYRHVS